MAGSTVSSIELNHSDSAGAPIRAVYSKIVPVYAVYRTAERVMIQYADDPALGSEQRQCVAPVNAVRGEINGMIDDMRCNPKPRAQLRADLLERRLADALGVLLQGHVEHSTSLMTSIRDELSRERASWARFQYLMWASLAVATTIVIAALATSSMFRRAFDVTVSDTQNALWLAAAAGAMGAFFSIAIAIRKREITAELILRDNIADAVLRILIAAIAAPLLIALMKSDVMVLMIGAATISKSVSDPLLVVIAAFLAGFVERLVPDLLEKASPVAAPAAAGAGAAMIRVAGVAASEINPRGVATPAAIAGVAPSGEDAGADADKHLDECLCDVETEDDHTQDVELPEATGGVEVPADKLT